MTYSEHKDAVKNLILLKDFASSFYFSSEFATTYEQVALNMDIFTELYTEDYKELFLKSLGKECQTILDGFKTIMLNSKDIVSTLTSFFNKLAGNSEHFEHFEHNFKDLYKNPDWLIQLKETISQKLIRLNENTGYNKWIFIPLGLHSHATSCLVYVKDNKYHIIYMNSGLGAQTHGIDENNNDTFSILVYNDVNIDTVSEFICTYFILQFKTYEKDKNIVRVTISKICFEYILNKKNIDDNGLELFANKKIYYPSQIIGDCSIKGYIMTMYYLLIDFKKVEDDSLLNHFLNFELLTRLLIFCNLKESSISSFCDKDVDIYVVKNIIYNLENSDIMHLDYVDELVKKTKIKLNKIQLLQFAPNNKLPPKIMVDYNDKINDLKLNDVNVEIIDLSNELNKIQIEKNNILEDIRLLRIDITRILLFLETILFKINDESSALSSEYPLLHNLTNNLFNKNDDALKNSKYFIYFYLIINDLIINMDNVNIDTYEQFMRFFQITIKYNYQFSTFKSSYLYYIYLTTFLIKYWKMTYTDYSKYGFSYQPLDIVELVSSVLQIQLYAKIPETYKDIGYTQISYFKILDNIKKYHNSDIAMITPFIYEYHHIDKSYTLSNNLIMYLITTDVIINYKDNTELSESFKITIFIKELVTRILFNSIIPFQISIRVKKDFEIDYYMPDCAIIEKDTYESKDDDTHDNFKNIEINSDDPNPKYYIMKSQKFLFKLFKRTNDTITYYELIGLNDSFDVNPYSICIFKLQQPSGKIIFITKRTFTDTQKTSFSYKNREFTVNHIKDNIFSIKLFDFNINENNIINMTSNITHILYNYSQLYLHNSIVVPFIYDKFCSDHIHFTYKYRHFTYLTSLSDVEYKGELIPTGHHIENINNCNYYNYIYNIDDNILTTFSEYFNKYKSNIKQIINIIFNFLYIFIFKSKLEIFWEEFKKDIYTVFWSSLLENRNIIISEIKKKNEKDNKLSLLNILSQFDIIILYFYSLDENISSLNRISNIILNDSVFDRFCDYPYDNKPHRYDKIGDVIKSPQQKKNYEYLSRNANLSFIFKEDIAYFQLENDDKYRQDKRVPVKVMDDYLIERSIIMGLNEMKYNKIIENKKFILDKCGIFDDLCNDNVFQLKEDFFISTRLNNLYIKKVYKIEYEYENIKTEAYGNNKSEGTNNKIEYIDTYELINTSENKYSLKLIHPVLIKYNYYFYSCKWIKKDENTYLHNFKKDINIIYNYYRAKQTYEIDILYNRTDEAVKKYKLYFTYDHDVNCIKTLNRFFLKFINEDEILYGINNSKQDEPEIIILICNHNKIFTYKINSEKLYYDGFEVIYNDKLLNKWVEFSSNMFIIKKSEKERALVIINRYCKELIQSKQRINQFINVEMYGSVIELYTQFDYILDFTYNNLYFNIDNRIDDFILYLYYCKEYYSLSSINELSWLMKRAFDVSHIGKLLFSYLNYHGMLFKRYQDEDGTFEIMMSILLNSVDDDKVDNFFFNYSKLLPKYIFDNLSYNNNYSIYYSIPKYFRLNINLFGIGVNYKNDILKLIKRLCTKYKIDIANKNEIQFTPIITSSFLYFLIYLCTNAKKPINLSTDKEESVDNIGISKYLLYINGQSNTVISDDFIESIIYERSYDRNREELEVVINELFKLEDTTDSESEPSDVLDNIKCDNIIFIDIQTGIITDPRFSIVRFIQFLIGILFIIENQYDYNEEPHMIKFSFTKDTNTKKNVISYDNYINTYTRSTKDLNSKDIYVSSYY